jgi:tetratricopeptide (TPR) repeat protein
MRLHPLLPLSLGAALIALGSAAAHSAQQDQVIRLLEQRRCSQCQLQDADLVHADLRDAQLQGAQLQRANLSGSRLDGADLRGANLSFTSLEGASLRGADLRGSQLLGTDLRRADLSGARLDPRALGRSHWQGAQGIASSQQGYAELHNAGVSAAQQGRYPEAEARFSEAIQQQPEAAISWVARGISRSEQGQSQWAAQDFRYAALLYRQAGDKAQAQALEKAADQLLEPRKASKGGNGLGSGLMGGAMAALQFLAPIAAKALVPAPF